MEQAALKGHVKGMFGAGVCYSAAFGRAQDNATALKWFCKAAKQVIEYPPLTTDLMDGLCMHQRLD
jgi:TPR repeat protein